MDVLVKRKTHEGFNANNVCIHNRWFFSQNERSFRGGVKTSVTKRDEVVGVL